MMSTTDRQGELLVFLRSEKAAARAPSVQEMCDALGIKSKSSVARLLDALEARGRVKRLSNRARAIEIIETPIVEVFAGGGTLDVRLDPNFPVGRLHELRTAVFDHIATRIALAEAEKAVAG